MDLAAKKLFKSQLLIAAAIAFFMLLTRGSHTLTPFSLPDASVVLFYLVVYIYVALLGLWHFLCWLPSSTLARLRLTQFKVFA